MKKKRYFFVTYSSVNSIWTFSNVAVGAAISKEGRTWVFSSSTLTFRLGVFYEASDGSFGIFDACRSTHMAMFIEQAFAIEADSLSRDKNQRDLMKKICTMAKKRFSFS